MAKFKADHVIFVRPVVKGFVSWHRGMNEHGVDVTVDEDRRIIIVKPQSGGSTRVPFEQVVSYALTSMHDKD